MNPRARYPAQERPPVRFSVWVHALLVVALGACGGTAPVSQTPDEKRSPVAMTERPAYAAVVTIVVDQLAAWVLSERIGALPAEGGFARLRREGSYVPDLRYDFAITETAPGHAALYTGASPRESGIIGNEAVDASGTPRPVVRDERTSLIGAAGPLPRAGTSLAALRVETIADVLRKERPGAEIVGISYKDRSAIFGGGRKPNASVWFDSASNAFVTSTAFATELPGFAKLEPPALPTTWNPLDPAWLAEHTQTADAEEGEADVDGLGTTFPHTVASLDARRATPFANEDLFALALSRLAARPERGTPLFLALSLSAHDLIGHAFGPDSWEAWDALRRLDAHLARFLDALDQAFGSSGHALLLSSDHGIVPLPEVTLAGRVRPDCRDRTDRWERPCGESGRLMFDRLMERLESEAERALGQGPWLSGYVEPCLHFRAAGRALSPSRREALVAAVTKALLGEPGVARVIDVATLPATCPQSDDIDALVCRSVSPGKSGELYLVPKPGFFFVSKPRPRGTTHGSPYLYDRAVPLLVRAPGRVAPNRIVSEPLDFRAFPRTAAALLDIEAPSAARSGRDLAGLQPPAPPQ